MPMTCGLMNPTARQCSARAIFSSSGLPARPAHMETPVNSATPMMNKPPRPNKSPARPAVTRPTPKVSANAESTHCRSELLAPSPCCMDGNATLTILTSTRDMNNAMLTVARIRQRRGSGGYDSALAAELGLTCTTLVDREIYRRLGRISPVRAENLDKWRTLITV